MKKALIIFGILIVIVLVGLWLFYISPGEQQIVSRCTDYNSRWLGMVDCYGVISIWQPHNSGYLIEDNLQPGSIIAQIKESDDFVVQGNQIYLIDITPAGQCNNLMPGKYCGSFQINSRLESFYYDTPDEVPRYLIINTQTGDEEFYVQPQDASSSDQAIFHELINKENTWYDKVFGSFAI